MMYNYPFFKFPNFRRNYYQNPAYFFHTRPNNAVKNSNNGFIDNNYKHIKNTTPLSCNKQDEEKVIHKDEDSRYDNECFEIFGFKLHSDDLLILALLFFLYKEGSDDIYLYIALFLLLLN